VNIKQLIESSKRVQSYRPNPSIAAFAESIGLNVDDILKLNSNENLFLDKKLMNGVLVEAAQETDPRLYPQCEDEKLRELLGELNRVSPSQIVVSAGGDQVIELLFSLFEKGDSVTAVTPTFSMYPRAAAQRDVELREAVLEPDFSLNVKKTLELADGSSMLVVCSPNNPTGNQFPRDTVVKLLEGFSGLVLVDEAYQEYAEYSIADLVSKYENLIVLRTFSKAYGLAGLRLGYCFAGEMLASTLRERFMMPYPVPNVVLNAGIKILGKQSLIKEIIEKTKAEREWLIAQLNRLEGVTAYPSDTNFVLFKTQKPYTEVYDTLMSRGVIISRQGNILGNDCLRVTVAPRALQTKFLEALEEAIK
jgi:histidinol-phosphate aminotransferase